MAAKPNKSTWWSVTAFNDEIALLEDKSHYPPEVKTVFGGREKCPETGKEHFQGCVQLYTQQRMSWFKSWLKTAHLEPARHKDALIKYAMKEDTATGEKLERTNPLKHFTADEICLELARKIFKQYKTRPMDKEPKDWFWTAANTMLLEDPKLAGQLMNPSLKGFWCETREVWVTLAQAEHDEIENIINNASDNDEE